jgi:hypothetical protein
MRAQEQAIREKRIRDEESARRTREEKERYSRAKELAERQERERKVRERREKARAERLRAERDERAKRTLPLLCHEALNQPYDGRSDVRSERTVPDPRMFNKPKGAPAGPQQGTWEEWASRPHGRGKHCAKYYLKCDHPGAAQVLVSHQQAVEDPKGGSHRCPLSSDKQHLV